MPLIVTERHSARDLDHWRRLEKADAVDAQRLAARLDVAEIKAARVIRDFAAAGDCYMSISWGKDSIAVAYILAKLEREEGLALPCTWVRVRRFENPDCSRARDAFLEQWPLSRYEEITVDAGEDRAGGTSALGFKEAARRWGDRHISGVRGAESRVRRIAMHRWGTASARTARPIGWWPTAWIFAHAYLRQLPVHPVYGYTGGGTWPREHLRTASLGGERGGEQRSQWEGHYYPDIVG